MATRLILNDAVVVSCPTTFFSFPLDLLKGQATRKTLQQQAHGFRDIELFKLKIHDFREPKYALVGWVLVKSNFYMISAVQYVCKKH
jgi:hypothetical protein